MLKGAQASATRPREVVDIMTFVDGRMHGAAQSRSPARVAGGCKAAAPASGHTDAVKRTPTGGHRASSALEVAAIAAVGYPLIAAARADASLARRAAPSISTRCAASGRQPILALWHGRILPAIFYFRDRGVVAMTSENFDGEWIARHHAALRIRCRRADRRAAAAGAR